MEYPLPGLHLFALKLSQISFFLSYDIARKINILLISQDLEQTQSNGKESIQSLFGAEPAFNMTVTSVRNIDYSSFSRNNLILLLEPDSISSGLSQELKKYTENGGSLLVIPSDEINVNSYRDFLRQMDMNYPENKDTSSTRISAINREHMIYRDVFEEEQNENINIDLPVVHKQYRISRLSQTKEEWLMKTQNGNNVLSRYPVGSGFAYLSGISLSEEFSNFTQHAIFVPTLFQIALNSRPTGKLYYTIGNDNYIEINNPAAAKPGTDNIYHIVSEDKTIDFIPETKAFDSRVRLYMHDQVLKAGNYYITRGADTISTAAFNYNRSESDLLAYSSDELKRVIQKQGLANFSLMDSDIRIIGKTIGEISEGIRLWKYCIILALFFLTAEIVLLRWWK